MIDYDLMLSVLADASLKATAVLAIAAAATAALRRASSALRHAVWLAAAQVRMRILGHRLNPSFAIKVLIF